MHPEKLRRLSSRLYTIAQAASPFGTTQEEGGSWVVRDAVAYSLGASDREAFTQILGDLLNSEGWSDKFSERFLDARLHAVLAAAIDGATEEDTQARLGVLVQEYEAFATEQLVILPVEGIALVSGPVSIGNVRLAQVNPETIEALGAMSDAVLSRTREPEERKPELMARSRRRLADHLTDKVVAEYRIIAEPIRARERAEEEARRALELLRFAIPALYRRDQRVFIGLPGEVARSIRECFAFSVAAVSYERTVAGAFQPLELTESRLADLTEIGVFIASTILQQSAGSLTDFDKTLLNAIHWFSAAQTQVESENGFLALITCVESLLTPRDGSPIGTALAEGVAILLGDSLEVRRSMKRRFKELYAKRSAVSHGGGKAVLDIEYSELERAAGELLSRLLRRRAEFQTQKQLMEWLEDQKLSPQVSSGVDASR